MAKEAHKKAAEHHDKDDAAAHEHSTKAHASSAAAHKSSEDAHAKSAAKSKK